METIISLPARRGEVEAWLGSPPGGDLVKENRIRSVHRWNGLYIKRFKNAGLVQRLRSRFNDRALHEFRLLARLRERDIAAPEPVAWARRGASTFLFTKEIPGAVVLKSLPLDRPLLLDLARFVRALQDAGFRDDDLHVGNILKAGDALYVVDVHRAAFVGRLTRHERVESVAFALLSFYTTVSTPDAVRFIRACGADPLDVWHAFQAARDRYYRDRQSRVRRDGSDFQVTDGLVLRRPFTGEEARRALAASPLRVVKDLPRRRLWLADKRTFVKEADGALWSNGFGLETRGIPTPRLLAVSGRRVVGQWIDGALPLWDHLKVRGVSSDLLRRLARLVRRMHVRGVFHRDLKANNILVRGSEIYVVDLDGVDFMREVPRDKRVWNLAQLNAAVGAPVTRADRLRFFFCYAGRNRAMRLGWKGWVRDIMRITAARKHVWP